jgi:hypothetical protein
MVMRTRYLLFVAAAAALSGESLLAQGSSAPPAQPRVASVLFYDARIRPPTDVAEISEDQGDVFAFPVTLVNRSDKQREDRPLDCGELSGVELGHVLELLTCVLDTADSTPAGLAKRVAAAEAVAALVTKSGKEGRLRVVSSKGDAVRIVTMQTATAVANPGPEAIIVVRGKKAQLKIQESSRGARVATDVETLARLAFAVVGAAPAGLAPQAPPATPDPAKDKPLKRTWLTVHDHTLKNVRASLAVAASLGESDTDLAVGLPGSVLKAYRAAVRKQQQLAAAGPPFVRDSACQSQAPRAQFSSSAFHRLACTLVAETAAPGERTAAALGLGESGQPAAIGPLTYVLDSASGRASSGDAQNAGARRNAEADDAELRAAVVTALGKLASAGASRQAPARAEPSPTTAPSDSASKAQDSPPRQGATTGGERSAQDKALKASLVTGPAEHWFLSADVPLNRASKLAVKEGTNEVELADEPSKFYVGLDFLIGDLLTADRPRILGFLPLNDLVLKGMITASSKPLESLGVGLGLRGQYLKRFGVDFEVFTPWVGYTFTKQDETKNQEVQRNAGRNREVRFGVGLNLDKALGWVQPSK